MFGKLFSAIKTAVAVTVSTALPVLITAVEPEALLSTAIAAVVKHTPFIPNRAIPALSAGTNVLVRAAMGADITAAVNDGIRAFVGGWAIHRSVKEPLRAVVKSPTIAERVGPGDRFSI